MKIGSEGVIRLDLSTGEELFLNVSFARVIICNWLLSIDNQNDDVELYSFFSHIQYVEDEEDGQSEDEDGSDSPKPFDK